MAKPAAKQKIVRKYRKLDGKVVVPTLYFGKHAGNGRYMAGSVDDQLVLDEKGIPVPFRSIGQIE